MVDRQDDTQSLLEEIYEAEREESPEAKVQILGRELINRVFMLYRTGQIHDLENQAVKNAISNVWKILQAFEEITDTIEIVSIGDGFFINKERLKVDFASFQNVRYLSEFLEKYQVSGLVFSIATSPRSIRSLLEAFLQMDSDPEAPNWLGNASLVGITILTLSGLQEFKEQVISNERLSDPKHLLRLYTRSVQLMQHFTKSLEEGELATISRLQRAVHHLIDAMGDDTTLPLVLASYRPTESRFHFQAVNVSLLSIFLGREIGLTKKELSDLGTAALLHDIGKIQIPQELLEKTTALSSQDWAELKKSNVYSLLRLIQLRGFNEAALKRMLVAYEHTLDHGEKESVRGASIFSRIVNIAHCFVAMTTPQPYRDAFLPGEALKLMLGQAKKKFDPVLVQVFARVLTHLPPGTPVALNTREVGIVTDSGTTRAKPNRPAVRLLYDPAGNKRKPEDLDLAFDSKKRSVTTALDPSKYRLNPLFYFFV